MVDHNLSGQAKDAWIAADANEVVADRLHALGTLLDESLPSPTVCPACGRSSVVSIL